ncbi:RNA polymerase sigma factor [Ruicaihuangia caeni]|uniref:RNA polymerase sigma factor n=1 Tax=Ruicaihuangia caeni TaxID=3042517 RepID=UPI00338F15B3
MRAQRPQPGETSFETVLAAARDGEQWAATAIWVEYAPAVTAFLSARGSREPEDLASEVFLAVFDTIGRFHGDRDAFRSYVFSIAYRRLVDELRRRERRGEHEPWTPERDLRRSASAEHEATARLGDRDALALLDSLAPDQRDVMVLRIIADLTIEQVAAVLGKRVGAVKALQRRAIAQLRKKVAPPRTPDSGPDDSGE